MKFKTTWLWFITAAGLFAFIFFYQRHQHKAVAGPIQILPNIQVGQVTNVQVLLAGQVVIRAEHSNDLWQLTQPINYPAQSASIENLLLALSRLTPATCITARELKGRPKADEEYGFATPQATIVLDQDGYRLRIGAKTAPGDQVFLQVVGEEGVYVIDADLLKVVPRTANDWRDTTLINLKNLAFDRLAVTNGAKTFELQRDQTNRAWRMVAPIPARADNARIEECFQKLQGLRIHQFVYDDAKADLESIGLLPTELELALREDTNNATELHYGISTQSDPTQLHTRHAGLN